MNNIMHCKECGQLLESSATFCKNCGSSQTSSINLQPLSSKIDVNASNNIVDEGEISIENQNEIIRKNKIFFSEDEVLIDTLGSGFLSSLFVQDTFSKSVIICSNKRVYQRGKIFEKNLQGRITYHHGEKSVDLKEITGILYYIMSPIYRLMPVALFLFLGVVSFSFGEELGGDFGQVLKIISGSVIGSAIIAFMIFVLKKNKWFEIQFAGGSIITNCNWYPEKNLRQFMKNIALQKDIITELKTVR